MKYRVGQIVRWTDGGLDAIDGVVSFVDSDPSYIVIDWDDGEYGVLHESDSHLCGMDPDE